MSYLEDNAIILKKSCVDKTGEQRYSKSANVPDNYVVDLQKDLQSLGFSPGSIDGNFGDKTAKALKDFQQTASSNQRLQNGTIITVQSTYPGQVSGECDLNTRQEMKLWLDLQYQAVSSNQPPKAMSGHGTFIYEPDEVIQQYGSAQKVAAAMNELDMQHAWIRIHDKSKIYDLEPTRTLIQALKSAGIYVAGWGWCQGEDVEKEAKLALDALNRFSLEHYVADIEHEVNGANWTDAKINKFFTKLRSGLSNTAKVALSTHGFIIWHKPDLMKTAEQYVDYFAPQIYWFSFPSNNLLDAASVSSQNYPLNNPASYMRLCLKVWRDITQKPLIVAGQAYWEEGISRDKADQKLKLFLSNFSDWTKLQGLNWWHLGGQNQAAMSSTMFSSLKEAKLNSKFPHI